MIGLFDNLNKKSLAYEKNAGGDKGGEKTEHMRHVFLLNNAAYLHSNLSVEAAAQRKASSRSSSRGGGSAAKLSDWREEEEEEEENGDGGDSDEETTIGHSWFTDMLKSMIDKSKEAYFRCSFNILKSHLSDVDVNTFKFQNQKTKLLSLESGRLLKSRFDAFNTTWEKIYHNHKSVFIPDESIRQEMIDMARSTIMPVYEAFFAKFSVYNFSKRHQAEYLKYPPEVFSQMLSELWTGSMR
jgi:hypothetical protein